MYEIFFINICKHLFNTLLTNKALEHLHVHTTYKQVTSLYKQMLSQNHYTIFDIEILLPGRGQTYANWSGFSLCILMISLLQERS